MAAKRPERPGGDTPPTKKPKDKSNTSRDICTLCSEPAVKDTFECGWCECLQHSVCLGISADQCNVLNTLSSNVIYFCSACLLHLPAAMQSYDNRLSDNDKLQTMEKHIDSRLDALEIKLSDITKQFVQYSLSELSNQIEEQITDIGSKIEDLSAKHTSVQMEVDSATESLQSSTTGSTSLVSTASSIADELADRDRRRNNIILYNFSEKSDREADRKAFNDMCQVVFSEQFAVSKVIRLGKRSEDKDRHRPLLVGLNQESNKVSLLVNSSKLRRHDMYKNVYLSPDRTKFERLKYKKLVEELKERRSKGETNLIIRNNTIISRPIRPQSSSGNSSAPSDQPMAPANNQAKPSSSQPQN